MERKKKEGSRGMGQRRNIAVTPTLCSGNTVPVSSETVTCPFSVASQHAGEEHIGLAPEDQHASQQFC